MNIPTAIFATRFVRLTAAVCLSLAANSYASDKPCADDASRLCPGVQPGEGRIANCLREHRDELSTACRKNIETAKKRLNEAKEACRDDMQKHCKDVKPGQGRIAQCLKQHEAELSQDCKEHLAKPQGRRN